MNDKHKIVVGALGACELEKEVEDTFKRFEILEFSEKINCLKACMGNPIVFFSEGTADMESQYATMLSMFLNGEWKLNRLYERMGF